MSIERDYYMLVEGAKEVLRLNESELDTPVPDVTVALQGLIRHGSRTYITMSQKLMSDFINGDCDMARHLSLFATEDKKEINDAFAWRPPMASHQDTLMVTFGDAESTLPGRRWIIWASSRLSKRYWTETGLA